MLGRHAHGLATRTSTFGCSAIQHYMVCQQISWRVIKPLTKGELT
uniref:U520, putative n=1 Tax=Arundo donax TaxID=35708 RepID=A0A0A9HFM0_ARUDO